MTDINDILNGKTKKITKVSSFKKKGASVDHSDRKNLPIDKGGRPKKDSAFANERKDILDKIFKILSISKSGDIFYIDDLDNNIEKQIQILELEGDIKKYFSCSKWKCFIGDGVLKKYISMVKYIFKNMNVETESFSLLDTKRKKINRHGFIVKF